MNKLTNISICLIALLGFAAFFPMPNIVMDSHGGTLHDYVYFISMFAGMVIAFNLLWKLTGNLWFLFFSLLSLGKLCDQFYSPYTWSVAEKLWDIVSLIIVACSYCVIRKKKYEQNAKRAL